MGLFDKKGNVYCARCKRNITEDPQYDCNRCGRLWCKECKPIIGTGKGWCKSCDKEEYQCSFINCTKKRDEWRDYCEQHEKFMEDVKFALDKLEVHYHDKEG